MNKESNKPCIKWPDKETVQKTLLTAFKKITQRYIVLQSVLRFSQSILQARAKILKHNAVKIFNCNYPIRNYFFYIKVAAFTKEKQQLSQKEVEFTRQNSKCHVECIIGLLKNRYFILLSRLPITLIKRKGDTDVATLVFVCATLTNFGEPVVQCLQLSTFQYNNCNECMEINEGMCMITSYTQDNTDTSHTRLPFRPKQSK